VFLSEKDVLGVDVKEIPPEEDEAGEEKKREENYE
jgi:hypothetical protein